MNFPDDRHLAHLCEWGDRVVVEDLFVDTAHRGRGIGRALMLALEDQARLARVDGIGLDTGLDERYTAAGRLYRSLGYRDGGGAFIESAALPPDREDVGMFIEILTMWTKEL